ncbi:class I adenylate-forming enzyme family protein [Terrarubrum flagellatum]|uniref:class I adenylate-forming enzyme family protein n=1 Tax=Terrirubrum flagellatum TaxID=2895980 RepID=UPI0031451065
MLDFRDFTAVTTLGDMLLRAAAHQPDKDALVFPTERRNYAELAAGATRWARGLVALGVKPGEHVGLLLPSCIEFAEAFFGVALIGAVAVPVNARYRSHELGYLTKNADLVALITTTRVAEKVDFVERLNEAFPDLATTRDGEPLALAEAPELRSIILVGEGAAPGFTTRPQFDALADSCSAEEALRRRRSVSVRDVGLILYTSGTTSNPKGCLISHEAVIRTGQALSIRYAITQDDVFWSPLPMYHIGAIFPICAIFSVEATYLSMSHFDAGTALAMLERERATVTYPSFGTFIGEMIYHPDFAKTDLSRVRVMNSNLAVQPESFREALRKAMPHTIQVGTFGMTETSGTVCTSALDDSYDERTRRLGRPLPGLEVRILRENGDEAASDEIGQIAVRGFSLLSGYYKDPEKTAQALRGGWFHTGDLGSLDASGTIMFHGRLKDMLKVGGENVAAQEVESIVSLHDAVKLCQVVGRPDARLAEVPVAFVELKPGAAATPDEIIAFCRPRIASFKVPRDVRFVTEWPMSASKIQKFMLVKMLEAS